MRKIIILLLCLCGNWIYGYSQLPLNVKQKFYAKHNGFGFAKPKSMIVSKCEHLDTCILKVIYRVLFVNDTLQKGEKREDVQILEIGKKVSHCYSYILYQGDSLVTEMSKKGVENVPNFNKYVIPEEVFTFSDKKQIEVRYRTHMSLPNYCYNETIPHIAWKLSDEHKDILGYRCQKATCRFRGRDYIAWYAMDIPLKSGPYKFSGLPGLILAISDTANDYIWECVGIKKGGINSFVNRFKSQYDKEETTTRENAKKTIRHFLQDPAGVLSSSGIGMNINSGGKHYSPMSGDIPPESYNPIEKE